MTALKFVTGDLDEGDRLDRALAALAGISRSQARRWIDEGRVRVDGEPGRASQAVAIGAVLEAVAPEPTPSPLAPEPIALTILHEDEDLIVIDKPTGLVVHPAPGHPGGTLVNALLHHCRDLSGIGGVLRPGIVHRLDRGTSGVLVAAKHDAAHRSLALQFQEHSVEREYRALVRGLPASESGRVDRPLGRHPSDRKRMSVAARGRVREAHTAWRVLRRFAASGVSLLAVHPETGRTHQIRVHLASQSLPILGDPVYGRRSSRSYEAATQGREAAAQRAPARGPLAGGERRWAPARQGREAAAQRAPARGPLAGGERRWAPALARPALHAAVLGLTHPRTGLRMRFESPLPDDLASLLAELERGEAGA